MEESVSLFLGAEDFISHKTLCDLPADIRQTDVDSLGLALTPCVGKFFLARAKLLHVDVEDFRNHFVLHDLIGYGISAFCACLLILGSLTDDTLCLSEYAVSRLDA